MITTTSAPAAPPALDTSFLTARPVVPRAWTEVEILLVGCGGTGSWLAPHIARLVRLLGEAGKVAACTFIDPDWVEAANLGRQHFCAAEIGVPKATALSLRYGRAWGLDIPAIVAPFQGDHAGRVGWHSSALRVIVGCVDNAAARRAIATRLQQTNAPAGRNGAANAPPACWWLDCGNARDAGQVLLGTACDWHELQGAFTPATICRALPAPSLQRPELLEALPEELTPEHLSCAELATANAQALMVNQTVATAAADMLFRLVLIGDLRRFATYVDGPSGVAKSLYTTPAAVAASIGKKEIIFAVPGAKKRS
jgi:PRTRC genetic system ThiF family protein